MELELGVGFPPLQARLTSSPASTSILFWVWPELPPDEGPGRARQRSGSCERPLLPSHSKKVGQAWLLVSLSAVSVFFFVMSVSASLKKVLEVQQTWLSEKEGPGRLGREGVRLRQIGIVVKSMPLPRGHWWEEGRFCSALHRAIRSGR